MVSRIDVHQHLLPARYREALLAAGADTHGWPLPEWSVEEALAMMDRRSIATGILSVSTPGTHFGDDAAGRALTREVNDFQAGLRADHPGRFGHFASLPLPDVEGAVAEAVRALDELDADGVVLLSNYRGTYLGDPVFAPLWTELDARAAVVFVHPTAPPMPGLPGLPGPVVDYPADTTRTATHMAANGVFRRYPAVKVILSHAGGFVPYAGPRLAAAGMFSGEVTPEQVLEDLRGCYFDTALSGTPMTLPSLLAFAKPGHVLYGSDAPFAPERWGTMVDAALDGYEGWAEGQLAEVNRLSAEKLFPRYAR
ncbi:putative TIM-barrel fold metal-dependent hydrolase [Crossiella equi]|uniref:TIM-barrel fold metal-dependent hydrolase n=1 Tax=Crossiella equi TaxID=130796 RepID=A0ABS5A7Y1_9PSEU|nr:amidohydrolase family protein [Crossiella equi]MBP2472708.1 putative TIM-barrel fold metal-dependent hydrolase [Crossiella equi]